MSIIPQHYVPDQQIAQFHNSTFNHLGKSITCKCREPTEIVRNWMNWSTPKGTKGGKQDSLSTESIKKKRKKCEKEDVLGEKLREEGKGIVRNYRLCQETSRKEQALTSSKVI